MKSVVYIEKAMPNLEKYVELNPTEKEVVKSVWQMSRVLKNAEKEAKYKAMLDALK